MYEETNGYFELGGARKVRTLTVSTARSFAQTLRLMATSRAMVEHDDFATKREVYYIRRPRVAMDQSASPRARRPHRPQSDTRGVSVSHCGLRGVDSVSTCSLAHRGIIWVGTRHTRHFAIRPVIGYTIQLE